MGADLPPDDPPGNVPSSRDWSMVQHVAVHVPAPPAGAKQTEKKQTAVANLQGEHRAAGYLSTINYW